MKIYCILEDKYTEQKKRMVVDSEGNSYPVYLCDDCMPVRQCTQDRVLVDVTERSANERENSQTEA